MPIQRWRSPAALQVKSVVVAAVGVVVAGVFFPLWFGVPVMVVLGVWGLGVAVRRAEVVVDPDGGVVVFRVGLLRRRVRLASVTAVQIDGAKVSVARSDGGEISVYAWRKSPLDRWLGIPVIAGEVAHAVSRAAAAAQAASAARAPGAQAPEAQVAAGAGVASAAQASGAHATSAERTAGAQTAAAAAATSAVQATEAQGAGAGPGVGHPPAAAARRGRMPVRSRRPLAVALLGCTGLLAVVAAFLVRVSWHDPVLTVLGAVLALALGVSGLFYVLFALWLLVTGGARSSPGAGELIRDSAAARGAD